jgi:hypothetical protein
MAQQIINNGTFDNDPSAEKIRTAFDKANENFTELYTNKLDKVSTSGVERAYIINADGSQGTKATSQFGSDILIASANNIISDNTTSSNVVRYTFLVPANTIKKGARIDILARIAKLNPVPTADAFRLYVTNDFSTLNQTQFAILNINGNLNSPFERCLTFDISTGNMFYLSGATSLNTDNVANTSSYTELTYDVTQDHWFSVFMQVNTSNLMTLRDFKAILTNPLP